MKALISPNEKSFYIKDWFYNVQKKYFEPIYSSIEDSYRIAQVQEIPFEIADPLFWIDCDNNVIADEWYFQISTKEILKVPESAVIAKHSQSEVVGAQTL